MVWDCVAEVYVKVREGGLGGAGVVWGGFRAAVVWVWSIGVIGGGGVGARTGKCGEEACVDVLNGGGGYVGILGRIRNRSFGWCRKLGCGLPYVRH